MASAHHHHHHEPTGQTLVEEAAKALVDAGSAQRGCTTVTEAGVMWQTVIHTIFILSAIGIAWTDRLMARTMKVAEAH